MQDPSQDSDATEDEISSILGDLGNSDDSPTDAADKRPGDPRGGDPGANGASVEVALEGRNGKVLIQFGNEVAALSPDDAKQLAGSLLNHARDQAGKRDSSLHE